MMVISRSVVDFNPAKSRPPSTWRRLIAAVAVFASIGCFGVLTLLRPSPVIIAFANSLSGPIASFGDEARLATQLYLDEINASGGIDGHPVRLQIFDDASDPKTAAKNVPAILHSPAVAVLGHYLSAASIEAGAAYGAGHIAAVAGNASADALTKGNPWYFRALTPTSTQAAFMASYIHNVMRRSGGALIRAPDVDLVTSDDPFGHSFLAGFTRGNEDVAPKTFLVTHDNLTISAHDVAEALAQEPEPRIIVLGTAADTNTATLAAIRRRGIHSPVIFNSGAAGESFLDGFAAEPEERDSPGFFGENLYAIAPVILDNSGALGETFAAKYEATTGKRPSWIAATAEDAARVLVAALRRAHLQYSDVARVADREKLRDVLAGISNPAVAVTGINGPLYFDTERDMPRAMHVGMFRKGRFISAPVQLVRVENTGLVDINREIDRGNIVPVGRDFYWLQRVVYTGIDITHLNRVEVRESSFSADFYLWMRFEGEDDVPAHVEFANFSGDFNPAAPLESGHEDGLNYRLYRISGTFRANFDLHDYPFDQQSLLIRLQNRDHPRGEVAYVIDTFGLQLDQLKPSETDASDAFRDLQLWHVVDLRNFVDAFAIRSTLGKPALFSTANRNEFSRFDTEIVLRRSVAAFVVKTLIPMFLLMLVVLATLFFPPSLTKERTTIPVTGILTSAVLLNSISSQLPPLGYTVALEYMFYVFFALCLMAMATGFLTEILRHKQISGHVIKIDVFGRIIYVMVVLMTFIVFWWKYGPSLK